MTGYEVVVYACSVICTETLVAFGRKGAHAALFAKTGRATADTLNWRRGGGGGLVFLLCGALRGESSTSPPWNNFFLQNLLFPTGGPSRQGIFQTAPRTGFYLYSDFLSNILGCHMDCLASASKQILWFTLLRLPA